MATGIKRTTANSNNIVITHTSAALSKPKSKQDRNSGSKASVVNEPALGMQDEDHDDSHEEKAALASPLKGSESRKMNQESSSLYL